MGPAQRCHRSRGPAVPELAGRDVIGVPDLLGQHQFRSGESLQGRHQLCDWLLEGELAMGALGRQQWPGASLAYSGPPG